jgi:hypothetical protein
VGNTEIDRWTHAGHEQFKKKIRLYVEVDPDRPSVQMTWDEWMDWQMHRDPIAESPEEAELVRAGLNGAQKPAKKSIKKAPAKKPANASDSTTK